MVIPTSRFPALKAREVLRLLARAGHEKERQRGSHRKLVAPGRETIFFAFHDGATVPRQTFAFRAAFPGEAGS